MKKVNKIVWGVVLIAAGIIFALNALNVTSIDVFFDGWWTLIIIIPCAVGLFTERKKLGNIIGVVVGVFLLLCCQDVLSFGMLWKLLIPAIIVIIGIHLVFGGIFGSKTREKVNQIKSNGNKPRVCCATFSGSNISFDGEVFEAAELTAVFGGVKCDLRGAVFEKDCAIEITAVFGGIDILVPDNIKVKVDSTSIFGGVSNKSVAKDGEITLYVSGMCMFGGVDIK